MSLWPCQPSRPALERVDTAAGRSAGGVSLGDAARRSAADDRSDARRGDGAADDDRQRSQRLAAAKQFDLDGQIG
ncbi:hypothetical protein [Methylobacterium frigidaeris]|uniref:Uncharacterized protein n=1 Tax=Methylobacterium frigidaeris TaxID=2038277 RepID=A0AA37HAB0_9HYPH|nr:hypothetical protein [Methylobacterium frigidaeris]GJD62174.1 hypothetical protein MPEAHAMD_2326 [Methylobacterium frigidaeris]